jgi:futalosine hydrolase
MQILLCAATSFEIQPAIDHIEAEMNGKVDVLITGIGSMQTAYHLTRQIHKNKPGLIIQAGIAGSFEETLGIKLVAIDRDAPADLGVTENGKFLSVFNMGLSDADSFPFTNGWLVNPHSLLKEPDIEKVAGITVNEVTTNRERIAYFRSMGAYVESMEGAALHYVALMENIPFLQLRAISNYIGERDKSKWKIKESVAALNTKLIPILKQYSNQ